MCYPVGLGDFIKRCIAPRIAIQSETDHYMGVQLVMEVGAGMFTPVHQGDIFPGQVDGPEDLNK